MPHTLKVVETPFSGTALLLLVAGALWLVYLVPIWLRRSEYLATERNAARLGQTLRVLAETAEPTQELKTELTAREVAKAQREAERKIQAVSFTPEELKAKRRRVLRSTTTLFTAIGLVGLVSSISLQAALWVTGALAAKTVLGIAVLGVLAKAGRAPRLRTTQPAPVRTPAAATQPAPTWQPPSLPEPLSRRQTIPSQQPPLPSRDELLRRARAAAAEARPDEAAAQAQSLAPVSRFDQVGRVDRDKTSSGVDLDEVLRRRRAV